MLTDFSPLRNDVMLKTRVASLEEKEGKDKRRKDTKNERQRDKQQRMVRRNGV
jgi:hypothetical protein